MIKLIKAISLDHIPYYFIGLLLMFLTSCQDYEPFAEGALIETHLKREYAKNFIARYGEIDPNQSWDLTTGSNSSDTRASAGQAGVYGEDYHGTLVNDRYVLNGYTAGEGIDRHMGSAEDPTNTWFASSNITNWIKSNLKEYGGPVSENDYSPNANKGVFFELVNPGHDFVIVPVYQGKAACIWDLHLIDFENKKDYKIWTKSQGILKATGEPNEDGTYNYSVICATNNFSNKDYNGVNANTIDAISVLSQPIKINSSKLGEKFALALVLTYVNPKNSINSPLGTYRRSDEGMMIALDKIEADLGLSFFTSHSKDYPLYSNGSTTNDLQVMIIGCEDIRHEYGVRPDTNKPCWFGDNDFNDIVFMLVGLPDVPKTEEIITRKRYLCEDLGNTYDFDFNDIVVDVEEYKEYKVITEGNSYELQPTGEIKQRATIRNMCGTLPFQVTVGNYTFPAVTDPTNKAQTIAELKSDETTGSGAPTRATGWDSKITKDITGWVPDVNNITIKIADKIADSRENAGVLTSSFGNSESDATIYENYHIYTIDFPGVGQTPLIIAVNQSVNWMEEYQHIPEKWWKNGDFSN